MKAMQTKGKANMVNYVNRCSRLVQLHTKNVFHNSCSLQLTVMIVVRRSRTYPHCNHVLFIEAYFENHSKFLTDDRL